MTTSYEINLSVDVKRVYDLLCTGMESGIGYWATIDGYEDPPRKVSAVGDSKVYRHIDYPLTGGAVILKDREDPKAPALKLDGAAIQRGLKVMAEKFPRHFGNFMNDNEDAETGDVFIQCCVLGDIVYG